MKIFNSPETNKNAEISSAKKTGKKKLKMPEKEATPEKKAVSEKEIREKLAAHVETSNTAKSKVLVQNSKQLGAGFLNADPSAIPEKIIPETVEKSEDNSEESNESAKGDHLLKTDIHLNDPRDSNTQEKLKTVLQTGAFAFNPKEREALEKILGAN